MILANELRIGNYYQALDSIHKVKELTYDANVDTYFDCGIATDGMNPIPLTEDILLKCGFGLFEDGVMCRVDLTHSELIQFAYSANKKNRFCEVMGWRIKCNYLHQLQNLYFALTGKELEVNI